MLFPVGAAFVCPGGDLTFMCSSNSSFLIWNISVPQSTGGQFVSRECILTPISSNSEVSIADRRFAINRTSLDNLLPLMSTLSVKNLAPTHNGTKINCTEVRDHISTANSSVTVVNVIQTGTGKYKINDLYNKLKIMHVYY